MALGKLLTSREKEIFTQLVLNYDTKFMFYNDEYLRFVNCPDGYVFNLKTNTTLNGDFSISHLRSKIYNEEMTLTVTKETSNPYSSWSSYRDDWIIRYLSNKEYLKDNDYCMCLTKQARQYLGLI